MVNKINLKVFNTLTRKIEKFTPVNKDFISIYNCGPSLHRRHTHIGNLRSYTFADFIKRYFVYKGYNVKHVIKITDVEDSSIKECKDDKKEFQEYTVGLFKDFQSQLKLMNILEPVLLPRLTDNIPDILDAIKKLSTKGLTYVSNGSVYFKVSKLKNYGQLVNPDKKLSLLKNAQKRMKDFIMDEKENIHDFCLWKAYNPNLDGKIFWESKYGPGRPGWHIGCAVISQKYLGTTLDIHEGGISHIFPHHENEIAIAEALSGKKFVNYWLHHDFLFVGGEKMSKKENAHYELQEIIDKNYNPLILRYVLLRTHYRQKLGFTWGAMEEAKDFLVKTTLFLNSMDFITNILKNDIKVNKLIKECESEVLKAIEDDFNVSDALRALVAFTKNINQNINQLNQEQGKSIKKFILELDLLFGYISPFYNIYHKKLEEIITRNNLKKLISQRLIARENKDYNTSDKIKREIEKFGITLKDITGSSEFICELSNYSEIFTKPTQ